MCETVRDDEKVLEANSDDGLLVRSTDDEIELERDAPRTVSDSDLDEEYRRGDGENVAEVERDRLKFAVCVGGNTYVTEVVFVSFVKLLGVRINVMVCVDWRVTDLGREIVLDCDSVSVRAIVSLAVALVSFPERERDGVTDGVGVGGGVIVIVDDCVNRTDKLQVWETVLVVETLFDHCAVSVGDFGSLKDSDIVLSAVDVGETDLSRVG